jgi:hypothetical protein
MGLALALAAAPGAAVGVPRAGGGRAAAPADYIAFLDDDDVWHDADKLVKQITAMRRLGVHMSSTLALDDPVGGGGDGMGEGDGGGNKGRPFKGDRERLREREREVERAIERARDVLPRCWRDLPELLDRDRVVSGNVLISSSVVITRRLAERVGAFTAMRYGQDYEYWKRCLEHTHCALVRHPSVTYDTSLLDRSSNRSENRMALTYLLGGGGAAAGGAAAGGAGPGAMREGGTHEGGTQGGGRGNRRCELECGIECESDARGEGNSGDVPSPVDLSSTLASASSSSSSSSSSLGGLMGQLGGGAGGGGGSANDDIIGRIQQLAGFG